MGNPGSHDSIASDQATKGGVAVSIEESRFEDGEGVSHEPSSDQMTAARVDANAPDSDEDYVGLTLEQEEKARAREAEKARTRWARSADDREERTRAQVTTMDLRRTKDGGIPLAELRPDVPLGRLDEDTQHRAAKASAEILAETGTKWSAPEIQRRLGRRLRRGESMNGAVATVAEEAKGHQPMGPFTMLDLGVLEDCRYFRINIEAEVTEMWSARPGSGIHEVCLLTDETGAAKLTVWKSAMKHGLTTTYSEPGCPNWRERAYAGELREGDTIRVYNAKCKTYGDDRVTVEVDRHADVEFVEQSVRNQGEYSEQRRHEPPAKGVRRHK